MSQEPTQPQPYPSYPPPPPPKKRGKGKFFAIGCGSLIALVVLIIVIAAVASAGGGSNSANTVQETATSAPDTGATAMAQNTSAQAPTQVVQPTQAPLKWTTTHTFSGNGTKKTEIFSVPDDWKLIWSCDPNSYGSEYNVIVDVTGSDGSYVDPGAVNTICKGGNTGGSTEEHQSGQVYLSVISESAWTIQIQELR